MILKHSWWLIGGFFSTPLEKYGKSVGWWTSHYMEKKECSKPPTSRCLTQSHVWVEHVHLPAKIMGHTRWITLSMMEMSGCVLLPAEYEEARVWKKRGQSPSANETTISIGGNAFTNHRCRILRLSRFKLFQLLKTQFPPNFHRGSEAFLCKWGLPSCSKQRQVTQAGIDLHQAAPTMKLWEWWAGILAYFWTNLLKLKIIFACRHWNYFVFCSIETWNGPNLRYVVIKGLHVW